jgi:phage shock protein C
VNPRRLYRSRYDRQLAGVAAGMAEYLDLDPTLVRILWILSALFGGFTILLYVILAFVIPLAPVAAPGGPASAGGAGTQGAPVTTSGTAGVTSPPAVDGPIEGWTTSPGWDATGGWNASAGQPGTTPRGAGAGFYAGVLLVVFGGIALASTLIPAWAGAIHLGPALLVALGAALLIASTRRTADES